MPRRKSHGAGHSAGPARTDFSGQMPPEAQKAAKKRIASLTSNTHRADEIRRTTSETISKAKKMYEAGVPRDQIIGLVERQISLLGDLNKTEEVPHVYSHTQRCIDTLFALSRGLNEGYFDFGKNRPRPSAGHGNKAADKPLPIVKRVAPLPGRFMQRKGFVYFGEHGGRGVWVRKRTLEQLLERVPEHDRLRALMDYNLPPTKRRGKRVKKEEGPRLGNLARSAIFEAKVNFKKSHQGQEPDVLDLLRAIEQRGKPLSG
ncbi:MAG: hypothetical protein NT067_00275 [Candidatus Diapherotrites archaeon]|nr:hypothetical protein [Candidatus Diapherotrites archaeon]